MPAQGVFLDITHTGTVDTSLLLSDVDNGLMDNGLIVQRPGKVYVPTNQTIRLLYTSDVALSFEAGSIRKFIDAGYLSVIFVFGTAFLATVATSNALPIGPAGGDLDGSTYPNPVIANIQGNPINVPNPLPGEALVWTGTEWNSENIQARVLQFRGTWDASTNTPQIDNPATLVPPTLTPGDTWFVDVAGNYPLGNPPINNWNPGDWAVFQGFNGPDQVWNRLENANWTITGNVVDPADFMGSLNNADVIFKRFLIEKLRLVSSGVRVTGDLEVTSTSNLNGNVNLGNDPGDLITFNGTITGATPLVFEGATPDAFDTTFAITDPTANRTVTFQNESGTVAYLEQTWNIIGNAGTNPATNFLGTTDAVDFLVKTNATTRLTIDALGASTFAGALTSNGLFTGIAGATITGTTNINTAGLDSTSIGNATGTLSMTGSTVGITGPTTVTGTTTHTTTVSIQNASALRFYDPTNTFYTSFASPALVQNLPYTLPSVAGTAGQYLANDGTGTLSWDNISGLAWVLNGNNNVTGASVLGSTNAADVVLVANNVERIRLLSTGSQTLTGNTTNTGNFILRGPGAPRELQIYNSSGNFYSSFRAGNQTSTYSYVLPLTAGNPGEFLQTDGTGVLSWADTSGLGVQYNIAAAQNTATLGTNYLFNVEYASVGVGTALGARISSTSKAGNPATGLTVLADGAANSTLILGVDINTTSASANSPPTGIQVVSATTNASSNPTGGTITASSTAPSGATAVGLTVSASTTGNNGTARGLVVSAVSSGGLTQTNPALVIGTTGSPSGYVQHASILAAVGTTPATGYSVYTYAAATAGVTLPGVANAGKVVSVINTSAGAVTVNIAVGTYTINSNRAAQFISNGTNWYPLSN